MQQGFRRAFENTPDSRVAQNLRNDIAVQISASAKELKRPVCRLPEKFRAACLGDDEELVRNFDILIEAFAHQGNQPLKGANLCHDDAQSLAGQGIVDKTSGADSLTPAGVAR